MKPYPFASLNHFTVPVGIAPLPFTLQPGVPPFPMPDLQDSSEDRSTAVLLEKQTRATFTRSREARQVAGGSRPPPQKTRAGGGKQPSAGGGVRARFWEGHLLGKSLRARRARAR